MGACNSRGASVAVVATAKVIYPDGGLQEYPAGRARVSEILPGKVADRAGKFFVCNADHLQFGGYVPAAGPEEELQPGQIYFVLPRSMLRRRLSPEDMATLAVRASATLIKSGCDVVATHVATAPMPEPASASASLASPGGGERRRRRRRSMSGGRSFSSDLLSIPEYE